ncbi:MAG: hypothetical protein WCS49_01655 [Bacilli bacterium]
MNNKTVVFIKSLLIFLALSFLFLPIIKSDDLWVSPVSQSLNFTNPSPITYFLIVLIFSLPLAMMSLVFARLVFGNKVRIPYIVVLGLCFLYFIYFGVIGSSLLFLIPTAIFAADIIYEVVQIILLKRSKK